MPYLLTSGCSHTRGIGIDPADAWPAQLAGDLGLDLVNLSRPGADSGFVKKSLEGYLLTADEYPALVIVQWPNSFRQSRNRSDGQEYFINVSNMDDSFADDLKNRSWKFWQSWMDDIVNTNKKFANLINLCLESKDFLGEYPDLLKKHHNIVLHIDEKIPGRTWFFDNAAQDHLHHSAACHRKWADRLFEIVTDSVIINSKEIIWTPEISAQNKRPNSPS